MKKKTLKNEILNGIDLHLKGWSLGALLCMSLLFFTQFITAHGTVTSPPSRVWVCFQENPESPDSPACEAAIIGYGTQAFYDWSEVARMDANGMHRAIIMDGNLASAGRPDKYGGLDQVRNDWVATPVTPGPFTITWTISAPHETLYYDVYITKADWTPNQPLTWDSLELLVRTGGRPLSLEDKIDVNLPQRTGKHVIYSIWQRSKTPEAFYSTSDVDFGNTTAEPKPPVASFTSDNGRCGGSEVNFSAADSYDPNGDSLTYSWDFGDGTTGEGVTVSHNYSNLDSATVTLTVSDGGFSSGAVETVNLVVNPACEETICPLDTPRAAALSSINASYENIHVLGVGGPSLSNFGGLTINWDLANNGLYQFSMNTNNGTPSWYNDLKSATTQNFNSAQPQITLSGSGFAGLDGDYWVTVDNGNFVMVSTTGGHTIYFSNSATAPNCGGGGGTGTTVDGGQITGGPFTFTVGDGIADNVSGVSVSGNVGNTSQWVVTDDQRNILGLPGAPEAVDFDGAGVGTCFIYHLSYNGTIAGLDAGFNLSGLSGDFDLSNRVDVVRNDANATVDGGQITGGPFTFTAGDGVADNVSGVSVSGNVGETSQWVVTDDQRNILGLPGTPEAVDFDGAGVGTCFIYHLSYNGTIAGLDAGFNLSGLSGDFDLSNRIDVVRNPATTGGGGSCTFGTPISTSLANVNTSYENAYVVGTGGPNLDNVTRFTVNWDLANNGLYQFSFNLNAAPWYANFSNATQNFNGSSPQISLTDTGISGLDGDYYVTIDQGNFVLVADGYAIYFSNSTTGPDCSSGAKNVAKDLSFTMFPNPAVGSVSVRNTTDLKDSVITIYDLTGKQIKSLPVRESTTNMTIDISGMKTGLYIVRILDRSGISKAVRLTVK